MNNKVAIVVNNKDFEINLFILKLKINKLFLVAGKIDYNQK